MTKTKMTFAVEAIAFLLLAYSCNVSAATYEPTNVVKRSHDIYHIDYNLQLTDRDWGITTSTLSLKNNAYVQSIVVFPLIILSIGGIFIFSLLIFWTLRYCGCMCFANRPTNTLLLRNPLVWVKAVAIRKSVLIGFFSTFLVLTVAAVTISWYGFVLLRDNATSTASTLTDTANLFKSIKSSGDSISTASVDIASLLASSTCATIQPTYSATISDATALSGTSETLKNSVSLIGPKISSLSTLLETYAVFHYKYAVSLAFAFVVAVCIMLAIGVIIRHKTLVIANISIGIAVYIILLIILSVSMVGIIGVGDFCMDPYQNLVDSLPLGGQLYQYAKYYVTCATTDPLAQPASDVGSSLSSLASNLAPIVTACVGDAAVASAQAGSVAANARLVDLNTFRACPVIQSKIIASLGDGVCKNVFSGFFGVWLCFFCSLPCLFITLATAAVIYEYFDVKYWMAAEANAHLLTWQTTEAPVVPEPILEKDEKVVDAIEGHAIEITDDKNDV